MDSQEEANNANFEELAGHCKVLSAKLSQMTSNNSTLQNTVEDLEDYYDRQIQMRQMYAETLKLRLKEAEESHEQVVNDVYTACGGMLIMVFGGLSFCFPDQVATLLYYYWSYIFVAFSTFALARYGNPADSKKYKSS